MVVIDFYHRLNNLRDEFLQANKFSKEAIEEGLKIRESYIEGDYSGKTKN